MIEPSQLVDNHLFLDIETTGLDAGTDEVIELGAVLIRNGRVAAEHQWLIRPTRPVPAVISALTGLTDDYQAIFVHPSDRRHRWLGVRARGALYSFGEFLP